MSSFGTCGPSALAGWILEVPDVQGYLAHKKTCPDALKIPASFRIAAKDRSKGSQWRSFAAIRKQAGIFCGSFLRKGEVLAYVGSIQTLKGLQGYLAHKKPPPP